MALYSVYVFTVFLSSKLAKLFTIFVSFSKFTVFRSRTLAAGNNIRTLRKEITTSLADEELDAKTIEISSETQELDKKKSSLGLFLARVKIFLLKRKKYDIQTLV